MKRTVSQARFTVDDGGKEEKRLSRIQLEALAQVTLREGMSKEQVSYEQWADTQPIESVVAWDEMGETERRGWYLEFMMSYAEEETDEELEEQMVVEEFGRGRKMENSVEGREKEAKGALGESRWRAVRTGEREGGASDSEEMAVVEQEKSRLVPSGMFSSLRSLKRMFTLRIVSLLIWDIMQFSLSSDFYR
jgi:hypothetical protein